MAARCSYASAYSTIRKKHYWDTSLSGGPIVEQATHSIDIMRYFGGEISEESITALAIGPELVLTDMPPAPYAEHEVCESLLLQPACRAAWLGGYICFTYTQGRHEQADATMLLLEAAQSV